MSWYHEVIAWGISFAFIVIIGKYGWEWIKDNFLKKKKGGEELWQDSTKKSYQQWKNHK